MAWTEPLTELRTGMRYRKKALEDSGQELGEENGEIG
jgi:hypothetical protein